MRVFERNSGQRTMTRSQVRDFDAWAISQMGIPGVVLMENAGRGCADVIEQRLAAGGGSTVCILCGTGNNGGDGFVIARHMIARRFHTRVVIIGGVEKIRGDARINLEILLKMGVEPIAVDHAVMAMDQRLKQICSGSDLLVDAIFGTGLDRELRGEYVNLVEVLNGLRAEVVSVDIPSGLDCDSGKPMPVAVSASATVTFTAAKVGFENPESQPYTGEIFVASIGIEPQE